MISMINSKCRLPLTCAMCTIGGELQNRSVLVEMSLMNDVFFFSHWDKIEEEHGEILLVTFALLG